MSDYIDPVFMDILRYLHENGNSQSTNILCGVQASSARVYETLKEMVKMRLITRTVDNRRNVYYWHTEDGINVYDLLNNAQRIMRHAP